MPSSEHEKEKNPAVGPPKRSATRPASARPQPARTPPMASSRDASPAVKPRSVKYNVCWVVAR